MIYNLIDLETTGFEAETDKIVEIALVQMDGDAKEIISTYSTLVNPGVPIPAVTSAVHHIVDEDVQDAPTIDQIDWSKFDHGDDHIFVAHNSNFDSSFLTKWLPPSEEWLCTQRLAGHLWPEFESYKNQFLRYQLGVNPRVREMMSDDPVTMAPHRALFDTVVTALILEKELEEFDSKTKGILTPQELSRKPIKQLKIRMGKHRGDLWSDVPTSYIKWMLAPGKDFDDDTVYTAKCELQRRKG
jgi:exodeoxyribonuclease X